MPTAQERHALAFLTGLALLAVGVRAVGVQRFDAEVAAANAGQAPAESLAARALAAQAAAVDSAARVPRRARGTARRDTTRRSSRAPRAPKLKKASSPPPFTPVDVNAATAEELERLPRVGPALARRIVEWREQHGPFSSADDLRHVRGIGPSTVRLLDTLVTFSGRHRPLDGEGPPSPAHHFRSAF